MNTAFYQRSRKVMPNHKTEGVGAALQSAFPKARDVIVDGEVVVKAADGTILPFGVQGAKKIKEHVGSTCCLIIFDVLVLNGDDLTKKSLRRRRQILEQARIGQWLQQVDTRASEAQSSPRDHDHSSPPLEHLFAIAYIAQELQQQPNRVELSCALLLHGPQATTQLAAAFKECSSRGLEVRETTRGRHYLTEHHPCCAMSLHLLTRFTSGSDAKGSRRNVRSGRA